PYDARRTAAGIRARRMVSPGDVFLVGKKRKSSRALRSRWQKSGGIWPRRPATDAKLGSVVLIASGLPILTRERYRDPRKERHRAREGSAPKPIALPIL